MAKAQTVRRGRQHETKQQWYQHTPFIKALSHRHIFTTTVPSDNEL